MIISGLGLLSLVFFSNKQTNVGDSESDVDELEEDDRDKFISQLLSIACLARTMPSATIPLFIKYVIHLIYKCQST